MGREQKNRRGEQGTWKGNKEDGEKEREGCRERYKRI